MNKEQLNKPEQNVCKVHPCCCFCVMSANFQEAEQILECFTQDNIWKRSGIYVHKHQDVGQAQQIICTQRE